MQKYKKVILLFLVFFILFLTSSCGIPNWFTFYDTGEPITLTDNYIEVENIGISTESSLQENGGDPSRWVNECTLSLGFVYTFYDEQNGSSKNSFVSSVINRLNTFAGGAGVNRPNTNYIPRPGEPITTYSIAVDGVTHEYRIMSLREYEDESRTINAPPLYLFTTEETQGFTIRNMAHNATQRIYIVYNAVELISEDDSSDRIEAIEIYLSDTLNGDPITPSYYMVRANRKDFDSAPSNLSNTDIDTGTSLSLSIDKLHLIVIPFVYVTLDGYPNRFFFSPTVSGDRSFVEFEMDTLRRID